MEKLFPNNIFQVILLFFATAIVLLPYIFMLENHPSLLSNSLAETLLFILFSLAIIFISVYYNRKKGQNLSFKFSIPHSSYKPLSICLLVILFFQFGINIPLGKFIHFQINKTILYADPLDNIYIFLGAIVLAPLCEEIIFRGIILNGFLTRYKPFTAITWSVILFTIIHIRLVQIPGAMLFGCLAGYWYYKTRSLGPGIVLHFFYNLSSQLIQHGLFLIHKDRKTDNIWHLYGDATLFISITSTILCILLILKFINTIKNTSLEWHHEQKDHKKITLTVTLL